MCSTVAIAVVVLDQGVAGLNFAKFNILIKKILFFVLNLKDGGLVVIQ